MRTFWLSIAMCICWLARTAMAAGGADIQGADCTPTSLSGSWVINVGVTFSPLTTGNLDFFCNIPNAQQMTAPTTFSIMYDDDTGTANNEIIATYYKMNKTTGTLTSIASVLTGSGCTVFYLQTCSVTFSDTFDTSTYRYFIAFTLERSTTSTKEIFWGATLN